LSLLLYLLLLYRVLKYIDEAESSGSTILLDGRSWATEKPQGFWVGPTVILHKNSQDKALLDEIFGPVLSVIKVASWEEAIAIENSNPYGNAACIYTERGANAEWFIKRFRAAMLGVNIGIPVPRGQSVSVLHHTFFCICTFISHKLLTNAEGPQLLLAFIAYIRKLTVCEGFSE
jgi:acyl-CoA reductase-like NAD-dependent aldehyde dehydrogenase